MSAMYLYKITRVSSSRSIQGLTIISFTILSVFKRFKQKWKNWKFAIVFEDLKHSSTRKTGKPTEEIKSIWQFYTLFVTLPTYKKVKHILQFSKRGDYVFKDRQCQYKWQDELTVSASLKL